VARCAGDRTREAVNKAPLGRHDEQLLARPHPAKSDPQALYQFLGCSGRGIAAGIAALVEGRLDEPGQGTMRPSSGCPMPRKLLTVFTAARPQARTSAHSALIARRVAAELSDFDSFARRGVLTSVVGALNSPQQFRLTFIALSRWPALTCVSHDCSGNRGR